MSRIHLVTQDDALLVAIGWDSLYHTYFLQVDRTPLRRSEASTLVLWVGREAMMLLQITDLAAHLAPYVRWFPELHHRLETAQQRDLPLTLAARQRLGTLRPRREQFRRYQGTVWEACVQETAQK